MKLESMEMQGVVTVKELKRKSVKWIFTAKIDSRTRCGIVEDFIKSCTNRNKYLMYICDENTDSEIKVKSRIKTIENSISDIVYTVSNEANSCIYSVEMDETEKKFKVYMDMQKLLDEKVVDIQYKNKSIYFVNAQ